MIINLLTNTYLFSLCKDTKKISNAHLILDKKTKSNLKISQKVINFTESGNPNGKCIL